MGNRNIAQFFIDADTDYLLGRLLQEAKPRMDKQRYVSRIIMAVKEALRQNAVA